MLQAEAAARLAWAERAPPATPEERALLAVAVWLGEAAEAEEQHEGRRGWSRAASVRRAAGPTGLRYRAIHAIHAIQWIRESR